MTDMSERRRFPRYPCKGAAELFQNGQLAGMGKRLRYRPLRLLPRNALRRCPLAPRASFAFPLQAFPWNISAKVVCSTPLVGMGMEFLAVSQEQEQVIAQIIAEVTGVPAPGSAGRQMPATGQCDHSNNERSRSRHLREDVEAYQRKRRPNQRRAGENGEKSIDCRCPYFAYCLTRQISILLISHESSRRRRLKPVPNHAAAPAGAMGLRSRAGCQWLRCPAHSRKRRPAATGSVGLPDAGAERIRTLPANSLAPTTPRLHHSVESGRSAKQRAQGI